MSKKISYLIELDGIRAIAAWMVMFLHFFQMMQYNEGFLAFINKIAIFGGTGVSLFFVLSGFLITRILIKNKCENNYFKNFYIRRSLRIFPLYFFFLCFYYIVYPVLFNEKTVSLHNQIYYWVYLQNFALTFNWTSVGPVHLWSLAVEEHFYLIWPFIVFFFDIKWLKKIIVFIIIFSFFLRIYFSILGIEVYYFTFTRFDELALGGLLAIFEIEGVLIKKNKYKFQRMLLGIIFPTIILWIFFTGLKNPFIQVIKFNLLSLTYFCFIALTILSPNSKINKVLKNNFFNYSGKISYGLYVWHPICFMLYHRILNFGIFLDFALSFILTYIISSLSFYLFENRFLLLKKHFG